MGIIKNLFVKRAAAWVAAFAVVLCVAALPVRAGETAAEESVSDAFEVPETGLSDEAYSPYVAAGGVCLIIFAVSAVTVVMRRRRLQASS